MPAPPASLEEILDALIALQHADFGNIQLLDVSTGTLIIAAQSGLSAPFLEHLSRVKVTEGSA
jgi:hypothetical protein